MYADMTTSAISYTVPLKARSFLAGRILIRRSLKSLQQECTRQRHQDPCSTPSDSSNCTPHNPPIIIVIAAIPPATSTCRYATCCSHHWKLSTGRRLPVRMEPMPMVAKRQTMRGSVPSPSSVCRRTLQES